MKKMKLFRFALLSFFAMMLFVACKPTTHTVTLNADNGSAVVTQSVVNGAALPEPADPSKQHYTFDYWYSTNPESAYNFATPVTSSFTLTAKYSPIVFTATYVNNNGSQNTIVNVNSGTALTQPSAPVKTHYTFDYWYTTNENTPYVFSTLVTSNITLNAKYHHTEYNVTFNANNSTQNQVVTVLSGETVIQPSDPSKQHFNFDYWYVSDENTPYDFDTPVVSPLTLQAKYLPIVYTISYDNDGSITTVNINSGDTLTTPTNPTKQHYDFNYWYADDSNTAFNFTTPITSSFTLTAKFTIRQYTITVNPNNGVDSSYSVVVNSGATLTRPTLDPTKPDSGSTFYTFNYWYKNNDINNAYNFDSIVTSSFELKAKFTGTVTYIVTFNSNNGSDPSTQVVNENDVIEIPDAPVKQHYTFLYWYVSDENVAFSFTTPVTSDFTLNAKYEKTIYTVSFNKDNGDAVVELSVESGDLVSAIANPSKASGNGTSYVFANWYQLNSQSAFDFNTTITSDIELVAHYTVYHRVVFMADGQEHSHYDIVAGQTVTTIAGPTKANYTFNYWYSSDVNTAFNFATPINAPLTLTAKYTIITYTVTFDPQNGSNTTPISVNSGDKVSAIANPSKETSGITSYTFDYWYSTDENTEFDFANEIITANITLHAKYIAVNEMDANILGVAQNWGTYTTNIDPTGKTELDLYAGPDKNYSVGDDNKFIIPVEAIYIDEHAVDYTLTKYNRTIDLYVKVEGQWVLVNDKSVYITEDADNSNWIDFKELAIGKVFKIVVTLTNDTEETATFSNIEVENGYNIYSEDDLLNVSGYATSASAGPGSQIDATRLSVPTNAIFFHNDIVVTSKSLPSAIMESNLPLEGGQTLAGTYLKDDVTVYAFSTAGTSSFHINGNFFSLDGSDIPLVVRDNSNPYATPDKNFGVNAALLSVQSNTSCLVENINIIGNSRYSNQALDKGGYIGMYLAGNTTSDLLNVHMRYMQTALVPVSGNSTVYDDINLNYTVLTNMWSLGIYNDSCDLYIQNSILKTFGGMAIAMADYANNGNRSAGSRKPAIPMVLSIDDNSQVVSNVLGNEAWFMVNNLSPIAMPLKGAINSAIADFHKTIDDPSTPEEFINFVAIVTVENPTSTDWAGCNAFANVTVGSGATFYQNPQNDPEYGALTPDIYSGFDSEGGMIETSAGGLVYNYDGFNATFNNFMYKTPEQVIPYIMSLDSGMQKALITQLMIFDVRVAAAVQNMADSTNQAIIAGSASKVLAAHDGMHASVSSGNKYLFLKYRIADTCWVGILVEMYDLVS